MFWTRRSNMWFKSMARLCVVVLTFFIVPSTSLVYPSLQWTPRNPLFQIPLHQRVQNAKPMSKVNIICPNLAMNVDTVLDYTPKEWLYENFWIVSKESYHKCNASSPRTDRLLLKCDTPLNLKYYTLVFQQYSATLQGLEFPVGQEYYFIATSDGTKASLDNRAGGNCARGSMKMKFYVCKNDQDPKCNQPTTNQPHASAIKPPIITTSNVITTNSNLTTPIKAQPKPTPKKVFTSPPTQQMSTEKNKGLQSDDPRETIEPTLSTHTTASLPVVTSERRAEVRMITQEECVHDHGLQPSWNVVIPLLVIIVVLVIMNSFVICRLKQLHPKNHLEEDGHCHSTNKPYKSYFQAEERKTSTPVSV